VILIKDKAKPVVKQGRKTTDLHKDSRVAYSRSFGFFVHQIKYNYLKGEQNETP